MSQPLVGDGSAAIESAAVGVRRPGPATRAIAQFLFLAAVGAMLFMFHGISLHLTPWSQAIVNGIVKYAYPPTGQVDTTVVLFREENLAELGESGHGIELECVARAAELGIEWTPSRHPRALGSIVEVRNRFGEACNVAADELISTDALALVRFGLRAADDPRITDTVKVIDHTLLVDLPYGPGWRRYNGDGYGEHEDGRAYDGTGVGRPWPLLAMTGDFDPCASCIS